MLEFDGENQPLETKTPKLGPAPGIEKLVFVMLKSGIIILIPPFEGQEKRLARKCPGEGLCNLNRPNFAKKPSIKTPGSGYRATKVFIISHL
jgi:hypothetical protein